MKAIIAVLLVLLLLGSLYFLSRPINKDGFSGRSEIPKDIYVTWHTKKLPAKMKQNVDYIQHTHPKFKIHMYDDNDCREFIKTYFDKDVLDAYDKLIPGAYKADLWRYCIMYQKGGIYMDIKLQPVNGFTFDKLLDKPHYVLDRPHHKYATHLTTELETFKEQCPVKAIQNSSDKRIWKTYVGLYNAFIVSPPKNGLMMKCIRGIVENCKKEEYGFSPLYISGPGLMGDLYFQGTDTYPEVELFNSINGNYIYTKDGIVMKHYSEYRKEQKKTSPKKYYYSLWYEKKVYM